MTLEQALARRDELAEQEHGEEVRAQQDAFRLYAAHLVSEVIGAIRAKARAKQDNPDHRLRLDEVAIVEGHIKAPRPKKDDTQSLPSAIEDLGLTAERIEEDKRLVEKAIRYQCYREREPALRTEVRERRKALDDARKEWEQRIRQLDREVRLCESEHRTANGAGYEIGRLANERPELFVSGTDANGNPLPLKVMGI